MREYQELERLAFLLERASEVAIFGKDDSLTLDRFRNACRENPRYRDRTFAVAREAVEVILPRADGMLYVEDAACGFVFRQDLEALRSRALFLPGEPEKQQPETEQCDAICPLDCHCRCRLPSGHAGGHRFPVTEKQQPKTYAAPCICGCGIIGDRPERRTQPDRRTGMRRRNMSERRDWTWRRQRADGSQCKSSYARRQGAKDRRSGLDRRTGGATP